MMQRDCKINWRKVHLRMCVCVCVWDKEKINERNMNEKSQSLIPYGNFIKLLMIQGIYVSRKLNR